MDEKAFLDKWQKSLGVEIDFTEIEERHARKRKEAAILEQFNKALLTKVVKKSEPIIEEPVLVEEVPVFVEPIIEEVQPESELIAEMGRQPEPELAKDNIVTKSVKALSKTNQQDGDIQAVADKLPSGMQKELDIIKKSIADFHRFAQRHSQMGGGGAGDVIHLDHPSKTVYANYTFTNKDYYVGAGVTPLTITLPSVAKNGRVIVVKDEVGNCSVNHITVHGTVDNDAGGFILAENNGGIKMIYNNGSWRII